MATVLGPKPFKNGGLFRDRWTFDRLVIIKKSAGPFVTRMTGNHVVFAAYYRITLATPHGTYVLDISENLYRLVSVGERIPAKYRFGAWSGKLIVRLVR